MVSPEDVYDFAAGLLQRQPLAEIDCRQASARAYYSVMLLSKTRAQVADEKGASSHQLIYDALFNLNSKGLLEPAYQEVLNFWTTLKDLRVKADYHIAKDFKQADAQRSVGIAKRIFDGVKNI
jgi:hypothetical protein